jgi:hypothetical protein
MITLPMDGMAQSVVEEAVEMGTDDAPNRFGLHSGTIAKRLCRP